MNTYPEHTFFNEPKGWKSWLFTLDHKRIGVMYMIAIMFFFVFAGAIALVMRMELMNPGADSLCLQKSQQFIAPFGPDNEQVIHRLGVVQFGRKHEVGVAKQFAILRRQPSPS
ncbi:MAG: hypothetical protein IIB00_10795, partial [candidate division Zixibacteria bacterium]|nr:hypothetical protein [candidate division Zixibacteria bacterium]